MINLTYGSLIRIGSWKSSYAQVNTLAGLCSRDKTGLSIISYRNSGEPEAWTVAGNVSLMHDTTIQVSNGEHVLVDGIEYEVFVSKANQGPYPINSNLISFIPQP